MTAHPSREGSGWAEGLERLQEPVRVLADEATAEAAFPQALQAVEAALQEFEGMLAERDRLTRSL